MKKLKIKTLAVLLIFMMVTGLLIPARITKAAGVSSKSFTITLNKKNPIHKFKIKLNGEAFAIASIEILKITGKAKADDEGYIYFGFCESDGGKGSLFDFLKPKDFKKGTILTSDAEYGIYKNGEIELELPKGVKKMKVKITFKTTDGSKTITKCKKTN